METHILKEQMTAAFQYSFARLALNYYAFYEAVTEEGATERQREYTARLNELLERFLGRGEVEADLAELREKVIRQVDALTAYAGCFQLHEYALNRMERRFKTLPESGYSDEEFISMLLRFLTGSKDSAVMNGRIQQILGELPIRFTKQKFFGLVSDAMSVYKGSPVEDFRGLISFLKEGTENGISEDMREKYPELYELWRRLGELDYKSLTAEGYQEAFGLLEDTSGRLIGESALYMMLQEMINDLYVMALIEKRAPAGWEESSPCALVLNRILGKFKEASGAGIDEETTKLLELLEGKQEACYDAYVKFEARTSEEDEEAGQLRQKISRLLSGSAFAALTVEAPSGLIVEEELFKQEMEELFSEMTEAYRPLPRPVVRAAMARVLSLLPVFFHSLDEIQDYIAKSLGGCTDIAEKETAKELLIELMETENAMV